MPKTLRCEGSPYIEDHLEKTQKTSLKKYGRENFFLGEEGKEITRQSCLKKYGVDNFAKTKNFF